MKDYGATGAVGAGAAAMCCWWYVCRVRLRAAAELMLLLHLRLLLLLQAQLTEVRDHRMRHHRGNIGAHAHNFAHNRG